MGSRAPILITGSHRSGTGWVGEMLAATPSPGLAYLWEPFNLRTRRGICDAPFRYWFTYVCKENEAAFRAPLAQTLAFRYHPVEELGTLRSPKDAGRFARDWYVTARHRRRRAVPLFKDPIALFSCRVALRHVRDGRGGPDPPPRGLRAQHRAQRLGPPVRALPRAAADDARPTLLVPRRDRALRADRAAAAWTRRSCCGT